MGTIVFLIIFIFTVLLIPATAILDYYGYVTIEPLPLKIVVYLYFITRPFYLMADYVKIRDFIDYGLLGYFKL